MKSPKYVNRYKFLVIFLVLTVLFLVAAGTAPARSVILRPYVNELRKETSSEKLAMIAALKEEDLVQLHHGYGTWIRNKWLYGKGDIFLNIYGQIIGINHPDEMSSILIKHLWNDLQLNH